MSRCRFVRWGQAAASRRTGLRGPVPRCVAALWTLLLTLSAALLPGQVALRAELIRFEIRSNEPLAGGMAFGDAGPYQRIDGRVYYELDPEAKANREVIDLAHAPRNERGKVELFADLFLLTPRDPAAGNGALLYDVNNRGNKLALRHFNFAPGGNDPREAEDLGDGFLLRHGFTLVWSGWDGELLPGGGRLRLAAPVAQGETGPITGHVRCEIVPDADTTRMVVNWDHHGSYRPTPEGISTATLTHRERPGEARVTVPRDRWTLHVTDVVDGSPSELPKVELELQGGLRKGHIYELIYEAQDPLVQGTGFTAVRDLIAALRHGEGLGNPLATGTTPTRGVRNQGIRYAYAFGVSQSGRFLREFLYWGFNADEQGRRVFDGIIPHVSGSGLGSFNHRFAQPTRHAAQHDHHDYPPDRFPFAYGMQVDPLSGRADGILLRSELSGTTPWVLHTQSDSEFWNRSGSLAITDPLGQQDAELPDKVRVYFFGGTQHGPSGFPPTRGDAQTLSNPADYRPFLRCLLLALDRSCRGQGWLPPSVYPTIQAVTLVSPDQQTTGFPAIPGIRYPEVIQRPAWLDFGPRWESERIVDTQPPTSRGEYRVLVPRCDMDGNSLGCLAPPEVAVPVATYTGWALRSEQAGAANELVSLRGSYLPFPLTEEARRRAGDPRPSLEARYRNQDQYLTLLETKCRELELAGYLLAEDIPRIVREQGERVKPLFDGLARPAP